MQIVSKEYVPVPVAKAIVARRLNEDREETSLVVESTYRYLEMFSKCGEEEAEKAYRMLREELGLKDITAAMLVSILPETIDEVRIMLDFEGRLLETSEIEKIIEILKSTCMSEEGE
ncbi:MAG: hypothetical protein GXO09_05535 [Crenarchaeota archaeon]|nr:hypothetical protein [Thermoproteota archaeon]